MKPLEILPFTFDIDRAALHRNVKEVKAVLKVLEPGKGESNAGVAGTENTGRAELYGWINPVSTHMDSVKANGWMYAAILTQEHECEIGCIEPDTGKIHTIYPEPGQLFRLNDRFPHWTNGKGHVAAIFVSGYKWINDEKAAQIIQRGLTRLAGGVQTAPRVNTNFRTLRKDEVWATNDFHKAHIVTKKLATKRGWSIELCAGCNQPATLLDTKWPVGTEGNRCFNC